MLLEKERNLVVEYGNKMSQSGLTTGTSGNVSVYSPEEKLFAISPSGIAYEDIKPEDVVVMNLDYEIVDGDKKPSSEYHLHGIFYQKRDDVTSVIHTHSTYTTVFSCLRKPIEACHYVIGGCGSDKVECAEYATYGTEELAENAEAASRDSKGVLLANHGLVVYGPSIQKAYNLANNLDFVAVMQYRAMSVGTPVVLDKEEMDRVIDKFKTHGQPKKEMPGY